MSVPARTASSPAGTPAPHVRPSRTTAARPPRHTPPHPHGGARRGSPVAFWIMVAVLAAVLIIGIASLSALFVQSSFAVDDLQSSFGTLQQQHDVLREEVAQASSPQRVMEWARARGMRTPDDVVILPLPAEPATGSGTGA
jgi:outer membrane murein-binding lipoprotein Lpp